MGGRGCENQIIIRPGSAQLETVAKPQSAWEQVTGHLLAALQPPIQLMDPWLPQPGVADPAGNYPDPSLEKKKPNPDLAIVKNSESDLR